MRSSPPNRETPPFSILQIGLMMERDALYARADERVGGMMAGGLEDEGRWRLEAG